MINRVNEGAYVKYFTREDKRREGHYTGQLSMAGWSRIQSMIEPVAAVSKSYTREVYPHPSVKKIC